MINGYCLWGEGSVCLCGWTTHFKFFELFLALNYCFGFLDCFEVLMSRIIIENYFDAFPSVKYFEKQLYHNPKNTQYPIPASGHYLCSHVLWEIHNMNVRWGRRDCWVVGWGWAIRIWRPLLPAMKLTVTTGTNSSIIQSGDLDQSC